VKATKEEVNYGRGMRESHCGRLDTADAGFCRHFNERGQRDFGTCTEVEGRIGRTMWCDRFEKATA